MKRTITLTDEQAEYLLGLLNYDKPAYWSRKEREKELINLIRTAPNHA